MSHQDYPYDIREKYTRFRILVIGRANAGKTTLLQRVCNTIEDPCIYDENHKNLLESTPAPYRRGIHDINRPFAFKSHAGFVFHDSPGFETGDKKQLDDVLAFLDKKAKSTDVDDQLHAIWFCVVLNKSRPLLELETQFFNTARAGNVPVIAIFTKFDDLMSQTYDMDQDDDTNRQIAEDAVERKFRKPLNGYAFPPRADVCFEALHNPETGNQVNALIEKTASSLDDTALKMLFVSVQQNNIELCIQYAIKYLTDEVVKKIPTSRLAWHTMRWFRHSFLQRYDYGETELEDFRLERVFGLFQGNVLANILDPNFQYNKSHSSFHIFGALLICLENSFWNHHTDGNFVDSFQNSFTFYIQNGTSQKMEADIDILTKGGGEGTEGFNAKFLKIIMDHRLPHQATA